MRSENTDANAATTITRQRRERDRHREEDLQRRVEGARPGDEDDRRRHRDHEQVQRKLGDVPHEEAQDLAEVVARIPDG